jgi:hypothetical protein
VAHLPVLQAEVRTSRLTPSALEAYSRPSGMSLAPTTLAAVSFDIFLVALKNGVATKIDRDALVGALGSSLEHVGVADRVETPDGGSAEVYLPDDEKPNSCMFALHGDLSPLLADTIVSAARAASCAIYWPADEILMAYPDPTMLEDLPSRPGDPTPVHCPRGSELRVLIQSGLDGWKRYRDQVIRSTKS